MEMIRIIILTYRNIIRRINRPGIDRPVRANMGLLLVEIQHAVTDQFARQVVFDPAANALGDA